MRRVLAATLTSLRRLIFYAVLPGVLAALLAWYVVLPPVAERTVGERLRALGLDGLSFTIAGIGPDRALVRDVAFPAGHLSADEIALDYGVHALATRRADRLTVTGLRWRTRLVGGRLDLSGLAPLLGGDGDGGAPAVPVAEIVLRDGEVVVDTDAGPVQVPFSGRLRPRAPALLSGELDLAPHARFASATVTVALDADLTAGAVDAVVSVTDGAMSLAGIAAFGVFGEVDLHATAAGVTWSAYVEVAELSSPLGPVAARATVVADSDRAEATIDLGPADRAFALGVAATARLDAAPRLELTAALTVPEPEALARRGASVVVLDEDLPRVTLALDAGAPDIAQLLAATGWAEALRQVTAQGRLEASLPGLSLPGAIEDLAANAALEFRTEAGTVAVTSDAVSLSVQRIRGEWLPLVGAGALAPYLEDGVAVGIAPRAGPMALLTPSADGGMSVRLAGDVHLSLGTALVARAGADAVDLELAGGDGSLALASLKGGELVLETWRERPLGLAIERARIELAGERGRYSGRARIAAAGALAPVAGVVLPETRITVDAGLSLTPGRLVAELRNRDLAETGGAVLTDAHGLTLAPLRVGAAERQPGPLLDLRFAGGGIERWAARLALVPEALRMTLPLPGSAAAEATVEIAELSLAADGGRGAPRLALEVARARAEAALPGELMPGLPLSIAAEELSVVATMGPDDPGTVVVEIARLTQHAPRPLLVPFALSATTRRAVDGTLAIAAGLREGSGNVVLDFTGRYDPARGQGQGQVILHPVLFVDGGFQPARLSPYFAPRIGPTTGSVSIAGPIAWSDAGLFSDVIVAVENLNTTFDSVAVAGVNAAITLDRLLPPSTPPSQIVALAGIDLGLPLTDGLVWGRLDKSGAPLLERSEWQWAGGRVATSFTSRPETGEDTLVLEIDGIQLDRLLELTAQGSNVEATGTLFGRIPVTFRGGEFVIVEGWLESSFEGGELHYHADGLAPGLLAGGGGVDLLLSALDNFVYSRLRIDLSGLPDGQTEMRFRIRGANPDLHGGAEIELNMSVTGRLEQIIRQSYEAYRGVPDEVARELARQGRRLGRDDATEGPR